MRNLGIALAVLIVLGVWSVAIALRRLQVTLEEAKAQLKTGVDRLAMIHQAWGAQHAETLTGITAELAELIAVMRFRPHVVGGKRVSAPVVDAPPPGTAA